MEDEVHLVQDQDTGGLEQLDDFRGDCALFSHLGNLGRTKTASLRDAFGPAPGLARSLEEERETPDVSLHQATFHLGHHALIQQVSAFQKFQNQRFERRRRRDHDGSSSFGFTERVQRRGGERGEPVEP